MLAMCFVPSLVMSLSKSLALRYRFLRCTTLQTRVPGIFPMKHDCYVPTVLLDTLVDFSIDNEWRNYTNNAQTYKILQWNSQRKYCIFYSLYVLQFLNHLPTFFIQKDEILKVNNFQRRDKKFGRRTKLIAEIYRE